MECVRRFLKAVESHPVSADGKTANAVDIDDYLKFVARTGKTHVPWKKLKAVLINRVSKVIDDFFEDQCNDKQSECPAAEASKCLQTKDRIVQCLLEFDGIPFTIQRIAELIVDPRKNYKRVDKFLRAVEKNVMVITTIDPLGNRIVTDSQQTVANAWNENLFPPPSPSSRVRRMSVDELIDTSSSNVASPQMVAAAMMPPPPSPPPFSPKQQKSPLPVEPPVDNSQAALDAVNLNPEAAEKGEDVASLGDIPLGVDGVSPSKALTKKPVIVWHPDGAKKPGKFPPAKSIDSPNNTETPSKPPEVPAVSEERLSPQETAASPNKVEPSSKRQRFNEDGCDCDSTTPDSETSSASPVAVSTVT